MSELMWTAAELAEMMGVPLNRIYELTAAGRLPVLRYGARRYYPKHATRQWLETEALQAVGAGVGLIESRAGPPPDPHTITHTAPNPRPTHTSGPFRVPAAQNTTEPPE